MKVPVILVAGSGPSALEVAREVVSQGGRAILVQPVARRACSLRVPSGIDTFENAEVLALEGSPGKFRAKVRTEGEEMELACDAVVLAMDGAPSSAWDEGGIDPAGRPREIVIVLGSAAPRQAFVQALDQAGELRSRPERPSVTMVVKDMLVYGRDELAYAEAQRAGVRIVRSEEVPEVLRTARPSVRAVDAPSGLPITLEPDLLLEVGSAIPERALPIGAPSDGPVLFPGNISLGPTATVRDGVFLCGSVSDDLLEEERTTRARAAATRAMTLAMSPPERQGAAAQVDKDKCSACLTCVRSCPFRAPRIGEDGKARIDGDLCQACGICVGACPSRALALPSELVAEASVSAFWEGMG